MSRDANGNYTLPAGNPTVSGTTIDISWSNTTMSDLASEITNSLDRNGQGGMLAPLKLVDGSVSLPAYTFTNETNTGWFFNATGDVRFTILGTLAITHKVAASTFVGDVIGATLQATGDTAAGDTAALGYTAAEGLILTGQGSSNDITLKNDADATVMSVATGTTTVAMAGAATVGAALTVTGAITASSTLAVTGDITATGNIIGNSTSGSTILSGGSSEVLGANVVYYAQSHGAKPNYIEFRVNSTPVASYDATDWTFSSGNLLVSNDLVVTGAITGGLAVTGDTLLTGAGTTTRTLDVSSSTTTTGYGLYIGDADSLTTGAVALFGSNASTTDTRSLLWVVNNNVAATGTRMIGLQQDANAAFFHFTGDGPTADAVSAMTSWTAGNTIQGFVQISIEGTKRWIPYYDDPSS